MGIIKVVCGIIYKEDKILLCRRKPDKFLGGYWEFPGGKVELGESEKDCLKRELSEELGMSVTVGEHFKSIFHQYDNVSIELIAYKCVFQEASFTMTDHDIYEWVGGHLLEKYELAPADIPIAQELIMNYRKSSG